MTEDEERVEARRIADALMTTRTPDRFMAVWHDCPFRGQVHAVRVLAARVARVAPDGIHHREYHTTDPDLDAALCGVVEAVRHRLPGRGKAAGVMLRRLGSRSHTAPWRLCEILLGAIR